MGVDKESSRRRKPGAGPIVAWVFVGLASCGYEYTKSIWVRRIEAEHPFVQVADAVVSGIANAIICGIGSYTAHRLMAPARGDDSEIRADAKK